MQTDFEKFEQLCINAGFEVYIREIDDCWTQVPYHLCRIEGHGIIGVFTDSNYDAYPDLQNRLMADNSECFTYPRDCVLIAELKNYCEPETFQILLKHLKHLGSKDGFRICTTHIDPDDHPWPKEYNTEF